MIARARPPAGDPVGACETGGQETPSLAKLETDRPVRRQILEVRDLFTAAERKKLGILEYRRAWRDELTTARPQVLPFARGRNARAHDRPFGRGRVQAMR